MIDSVTLNDLFEYNTLSKSYLTTKVKRHHLAPDVGSDVGYLDGDYWKINVCGKRMYVHRIVWMLHNGDIPQGYVVDHIDGNTMNNSIENLRLCTQKQNMLNRKVGKNNTSGCKGVNFNQGKWKARISVNGKRINLGSFVTKEEAIAAYEEAAIKYHKEFKRG